MSPRGGQTGTFGRSTLSKVKKSGQGLDRCPGRGKGPRARLPARTAGSPELAHGVDKWPGQEAAGSLMDTPPSRHRQQACALSRPLPPCSDGILTEPLFNATAQGGAECEHVCVCPCVVFSTLENSQTAERGEIRVIASNWRWKNSHMQHKRELSQSSGRRERSSLLHGGCRDGERWRGPWTMPKNPE